MFLNNYYTLKMFTSKAPVAYTSYNQLDIGLKNLSGSPAIVSSQGSGYYDYVYPAVCNGCLNYQLSVRVGSGDTSVFATDYSLVSDVTSLFSEISTVVNVAGVSNGVSTVIFFSAKNLTSDSITLKEFGISKPIYYLTGGSGQYSYSTCLLTRNLFDSPILVEPKHSVSFTIQLLDV